MRRLMRRQRADRVFRMLAVALIRARLRVNHASHAPRWSGLYVSTMNSCMRSHSFSLVSDGRIGPQAAGSPHQEAHKVGRRMGAKFRFYNPPLFSTIRVEMFGPPFRHFGAFTHPSRLSPLRTKYLYTSHL